jgi:hypothetical protein
MTDDRLAGVRPPLLELHRQLLAAERADMERFQGRLTGAEFLQIATDSLRLAWLQPVSELIVEIDETLEEPDDEPAGEAAATAAALILQRHPGVVMAHSALVQALPPRP